MLAVRPMAKIYGPVFPNPTTQIITDDFKSLYAGNILLVFYFYIKQTTNHQCK